MSEPYLVNDICVAWIEWAENPLATRVILTLYGKLYLRYKIAVDGIHDAVVCINRDSTERDKPRDGGTWASTFDYLEVPSDDDNKGLAGVEARIEHWAKVDEEYLLAEHCGDCTHVPCSCMKCHAENNIDLWTIKGLAGGPAYYVQEAFRHVKTLPEAIHYIQTPRDPTWGKPEDWLPHQERWAKDKATAVQWLTNYRETKL